MACDGDPCYYHGVLLRRGFRDRRAGGNCGRVAAGDERAVRQQVWDVPDGMFVAVAAATIVTEQRWRWLLLAVASTLHDAAISTGWAAAAGEGRESERLLLLPHRRERPELRRAERSLHAASTGASSPRRRSLNCSVGVWWPARPRPQLDRLQRVVCL